ncbi:MAG: hypothetical protein AAGB12_06940 [Pseudomonadota bacterium]
MKKIISFAFFVQVMVAYAICPAPSSSPQWLSSSSGIEQYVWVLDDADKWQSIAEEPLNRLIDDYHEFVADNTSLDQIGLLERQQGIFARFFGSQHPIVLQFQALIDGDAGEIGEASCLDQLLLSGQFDRVNYDIPTEFQAYIFERDNQLAIYVAWRTQPNVIGPPVQLTYDDIYELLGAGWVFDHQIHNHPFFFDNLPNDMAGTVIPSGADLNAFVYLNGLYPIDNYRITNGLNTASYLTSDAEYLLSL